MRLLSILCLLCALPFAGAAPAPDFFSALGLYPVVPGVAGFAVGSPQFRSAAVHFPDGGILRIEGRGVAPDTPYVQGLQLDGKLWTDPWSDWSRLKGGATLSFDLGTQPSEWGRAWKPQNGGHHTTVSIHGGDFYINGAPTYAGRAWNGHRIEGLLLNARMVQGIFDDANPATRDRWRYPDTGVWDPDRNTNEFVAAMPDWHRHGLLAFTLNLQGGSPYGYSKEQPWRNSAFNPDGALRQDYLSRLERILDRADELGMVVILGYFYQGQSGWVNSDAAIARAVDDATRWVLVHGYSNVMIEIENECNSRGYIEPLQRSGRIPELIARVRQARIDGRRLLVSASFAGPVPSAEAAAASDFVLVHGNGVREIPARIGEAIRTTRALCGQPKPILFNEDDNYAFDRADNNLSEAIAGHASWGFFDYRRSGEGYSQGFQCVPVDWTIGSERKRAFFDLVAAISGSAVPPR